MFSVPFLSHRLRNESKVAVAISFPVFWRVTAIRNVFQRKMRVSGHSTEMIVQHPTIVPAIEFTDVSCGELFDDSGVMEHKIQSTRGQQRGLIRDIADPLFCCRTSSVEQWYNQTVYRLTLKY